MGRIVLIPAYEPKDNVFLPLIDELLAHNLSIVVVDDGSEKKYKHVFDKLPKHVFLISYEVNKGKGFALKTGLSFIKEHFNDDDYVVTMDCDGQHKVKDAISLFETVEKNPSSLVLGSRIISKNAPLKSRIGNAIANFVFLFGTQKKIHDTQTGLRAFSYKYIDELLTISGNRYEYEMCVLLYCARNNIDLIENKIETIYFDENKGTHFQPLRDSLRILTEFIKFSCSSLMSFLIDYGLFSLFTFLPFQFDNKLIFSNIAARIISATCNFLLNYYIVFKAKTSLLKSLVKYFCLATFILLINTSILFLIVEKLRINNFFAKIIVEITCFLISWTIQKIYIFARKKHEKRLSN